MRRVVVYGSSGSGKSALAAELAAAGLAPHVEIDLLAFEGGVHVDQAVLRERFDASIAGVTWVVEGMHRDQLEAAIPRADAFVWIDVPQRVVAHRLVMRTLRHLLLRRPRHGRRVSLRSLVDRDVPFIIKSVRSVPRRQAHARRLAQLAREADVEVVRLSSSKAARAWVQQLRQLASAATRVDDLQRADLARLGSWSSGTHLTSVGTYLDRRDRDGDAEYLVVRDEDGEPVCKAAIDYAEHPGAGTIVQVATRPGFEGQGLATMVMAEAERRIAARGLPARLGVEPGNERARRLYDHLGYVVVGEREVGWEHEYPDGTIGWYSTTIVEMEKQL